MNEHTLSEEEKNELWKDDKFSLSKERKAKQVADLQIQKDYATSMGVSFFQG